MQKNILIVDDKLDDLKTMKNLLEKEGFNVRAVNNGAKAIDVVNNNPFDLILIDILMPIFSGYDLFNLLKGKLKTTKMAYVSIVPKKEANLRGIDGFIQKPFSPKEFATQIKEIL